MSSTIKWDFFYNCPIHSSQSHIRLFEESSVHRISLWVPHMHFGNGFPGGWNHHLFRIAEGIFLEKANLRLTQTRKSKEHVRRIWSVMIGTREHFDCWWQNNLGGAKEWRRWRTSNRLVLMGAGFNSLTKKWPNYSITEINVIFLKKLLSPSE